jgi:3-oxoacyl-[acyl-carrier-protein] synthase-3
VSVFLRAVGYSLPALVRTNEDLVGQNPSWDAQAIARKTGIRSRHVAAAGETSGELARRAAEVLLSESGFDRSRIDAVLFCTQTPEAVLPATACTLQASLGLPTSCAALDFSLHSSGFPYGLWLARALLQAGSAGNVLLLLADTLSAAADPHDAATAPLFGDAGAAALVSAEAAGAIAEVGPVVVGTDGRGTPHLRLHQGVLAMNGTEVFNFALTRVPEAIARLLDAAPWRPEDVDCYLLHQASGFVLEALRRKLGLTPEKLPIDLADVGNTSAASPVLLLRRLLDRGALRAGARCVVAGYGAGFSWACAALTLAGTPR